MTRAWTTAADLDRLRAAPSIRIMQSRALIALAVSLFLSVVIAGCSIPDGPVAIKTESGKGGDGPCLLVGGVEGVLVAEPTWGLTMAGIGVIWPHGYTARREQGKILLFDRTGNIAAREGDKVNMGNPVMNGVTTPCTPIHVLPT